MNERLNPYKELTDFLLATETLGTVYYFTFLSSQKSTQKTEQLEMSEYDSFSLALMKLLVGDDRVRKLLTKGMGPRKIENAVLSSLSWGRVPLLCDPHNKSLDLIRVIAEDKIIEIGFGER